MSEAMDRRSLLKFACGGMAGIALIADAAIGQSEDAVAGEPGAVVSAAAPTSARAGYQLLVQGGNAIDAAVATALVAAVIEPGSCGIAGYGAHMTIGMANGKVTCIDANSTAPSAARPDMFAADQTGQVPGQVNYYGWLAAGIPGILAGMQLALDRYGSKTFADVVQPSIGFARDGFQVEPRVAASIVTASEQLKSDPASQRLYFQNGQPPQTGETWRNPDLAGLLEKLATRGTVESFYRGDIARQIADEFQKHGGIATAEDFAAYRAKEVQPAAMDFRDYRICTAPLTAGGLSTLQALGVLKALPCDKLESEPSRHHAALEALRLAWRDRFLYFGDPEHVEVPADRLVSTPYCEQLAAQVRQSVKNRQPLKLELHSYEQTGTVHISAGDSAGNVVALTLTHGGGFGARVTVDGLGLTLGHGVSRFDPRPGYANSIAPGKRPLNNMTPTVVLRGGRPVLAIGGRGGRKIPNAVFSALLKFVGSDKTMPESVDAPRLHTEGNMKLTLDQKWSDEAKSAFGKLGYQISSDSVALLSAVSFDPAIGKVAAAHR